MRSNTFKQNRERREPPMQEALVQCWDCAKVELRTSRHPEKLTCSECEGNIELLEVTFKHT